MIKHKDRILLVDDEQAILDGLCRQHRKHFDMVPACGSAAGIEALEQNGPFAVVVSDYQMPGMNGTQFLAKARHIEPNMARIMLTGEADMQAAIAASADKKGGKLLTSDGVHMNPDGNKMMATGVLKAFGLSAEELKKAQAAW